MILRPAEPGDVPAILEIRGGSSWRAEDFLAYSCTVAEIGGRIAGYLLARQVAEGEFEILDVAVAREFRRRGAASALIREQLAARRGDWFLEVRESNAAARRLYEGIGFVEAGRRPGYYRDPLEAAVVMRICSC